MVCPDWNPELRQLQEGACCHCQPSTAAEFAFGESFFAAGLEHSCRFLLLKEAARFPFPPWCTQTPYSSAGAQAGSPKQMVLFSALPAPLPEADSRHMHSHQMMEERASQHDAFAHPFKVESSGSGLGHQSSWFSAAQFCWKETTLL